MNLSDLFSPLRRLKHLWFLMFLVFSLGIYLGLSQIPPIEKTTIYFSIKPVNTQKTSLTSLDPAESSMKTAQAIAGWAQNPKFREDVLESSGVYIGNFKRKISARKQNYLNVFWTIKLYGDERAHTNKVTSATIKNIKKRFTALTKDSSFPFQMTEMEVSSNDGSIPKSWSITFALFAGFALSFFCIYLFEAIRGKVSFIKQIHKIFPGVSILQITEKPGKHSEKLLEQFILTFDSPRLIGTFSAAEKFFTLAPRDEIAHQVDTPIFLVKAGTTTTMELENLQAIFGNNCGIIVFNK